MVASLILVHEPTFFYWQLQAARETGALQAAKNKLEKQVEELTWRLQLEKRMRVSFSPLYCSFSILSPLSSDYAQQDSSKI